MLEVQLSICHHAAGCWTACLTVATRTALFALSRACNATEDGAGAEGGDLVIGMERGRKRLNEEHVAIQWSSPVDFIADRGNTRG
jgi:hypothetical protein